MSYLRQAADRATENISSFLSLSWHEKYDFISAWLSFNLGKVVFFGVLLFAGINEGINNFDAATSDQRPYPEFIAALKEQSVKEVKLPTSTEDRRIVYISNDGASSYTIAPIVDREFVRAIETSGAKINADIRKASWYTVMFAAATTAFIAWFIINMVRMQMGHTDDGDGATALLRRRRVKFEDIIGCDAAKTEFKDVIDFLQNPSLYSQHAANVPKGVLLVGPPGTGKTLLARAAAEEAGAFFIQKTGANFQQMFVGLAAMKIRRMFKLARKRRPAIIYIDEFETIGRARNAASADKEQGATVNQLLAEMDGFTSNDGVLVIATTNHPEMIDDALKRPGRFDRIIYVGNPDLDGRKKMFEYYLGTKPSVASDVDSMDLARSTPGVSGAQIAHMVNEAAIAAAKQKASYITAVHLLEARDRLLVGQQHTNREILEKEREIAAFHESGHAVVGHLMRQDAYVDKVSITPRGIAGGYTVILEEKERTFLSKEEIFQRICTLLAGRAAEEKIFGPEQATSGASDDLKKANMLARQYVAEFGFSDQVGLLYIGDEKEAWGLRSESVRQQVDQEIKSLLRECHKKASQILLEHDVLLHKMATMLLDKEVLYKEEIKRLFDTPAAEMERKITAIPRRPHQA